VLEQDTGVFGEVVPVITQLITPLVAFPAIWVCVPSAKNIVAVPVPFDPKMVAFNPDIVQALGAIRAG